MSQNSEVTIISKSELETLRLLSKRYWLGYYLFVAMTCIAFWMYILAYTRGATIEAMKARDVQIETLQHQQMQLTDKFIEAWKNQQETTDLLITWGDYVKERTRQAASNQPMLPVVHK